MCDFCEPEVEVKLRIKQYNIIFIESEQRFEQSSLHGARTSVLRLRQ